MIGMGSARFPGVAPPISWGTGHGWNRPTPIFLLSFDAAGFRQDAGQASQPSNQPPEVPVG